MNKILSALGCLVLLGVTCSQAYAQKSTVRGRAIDSAGYAMAGVNVFLRGTNIGTISDLDGSFALPPTPDGDYIVVCSFVGFKSVELSVTIPDAGLIECEMTQSSLATEEIVVTASRRPQLASEVPASLSVISAAHLRARRVESLDVAIQNTSGVQLQGNQVNIRGSSGFAYNTGSRVLLLVDGMQLLSPDTDGIPFDSFPIDQIKQIEILKGPGSALYGSGALGGVINLISRPVGDAPITEVRLATGYYQPFRYSQWTDRWRESKNGRSNLSFAASHARRLSSRLGAWLSVSGKLDNGYLNKNENQTLNAFGKINAQLSAKTSLDVLFGVLSKRKDNFLFWNGLTDALNPGSIAISRSDDPTGTSDNLSTTFSLLPQVRTVVGQSGVFTARGRLYALAIRPIDDEGKAKPLSQGTLGFRFGAETQYTKLLSAAQLTGGLTLDANITRSSFFVSESGAETGRQPEAAAYAQFESQISSSTSAVVGLRTDIFWLSTVERVGSVSPKLGFSFRIEEGTSLRASIGRGFRVPSIAERYTDDQSFFPVFRNLDLRPETSMSYETGVRTNLLDRSLDIDVSAFWYELDDIIEPRFVQQIEVDKPRLLGFQFINLDRGRVRGIEFDITGDWDPLSFHIGYTYLNSRDQSTGRPLAYRPKHLLATGVNFQLDRVTAGTDFRYAARPEVVDSDFARFVPDAGVLVHSPVADVHATYELGSFAVSTIVNNLFNYYYLDRPALLAPPREFVIQVSARF